MISRERCRSCGGLSHWACVSQWTILGPATRRSPICSRFLSTRSRSTSHLSPGCGKTSNHRPSCERSSIWGEGCSCQWSPKASKQRNSSSSCRTKLATRFKVTLLGAPSQSTSTLKWLEDRAWRRAEPTRRDLPCGSQAVEPTCRASTPAAEDGVLYEKRNADAGPLSRRPRLRKPRRLCRHSLGQRLEHKIIVHFVKRSGESFSGRPPTRGPFVKSDDELLFDAVDNVHVEVLIAPLEQMGNDAMIAGRLH